MPDQTTDPFAPPISALPADIADQQAGEMQTRAPGWRPIPGEPDTNMLLVTAQVSAESRAAFNARIVSELRALLGSIFGIPQLLGVGARSAMTVTAIDTAGHTLDAGTTAYLGTIEMETVEDLVIPVGETTGIVDIQAVTPAAADNDATGTLEVDSLDWLADGGVILNAPLAGGSDPETDVAYDLRLREEVALNVKAALITAENLAVWVRRYPAVEWSWAIKGYNADTGLSNQARTSTAVVAAGDGTALLDADMRAIQADIVTQRETNWNLFIVAPLYTTVAVTATVVVEDDSDPDVVCAGVRTALTELLKPGGWMRPQPGESPAANYQPTTIIHKNALIAEAAQVDGVKYIPTLNIGDGSSDHVTLASPRHLPQPGTITVTEAS